MNKRFLSRSLIAAMISTCAMPVFAQKAGDNIFGVGWFHLAPNDSSESLKLGGVAVPNSGSRVDNADTVALTYTRMITDNIGATLDVGIPPTFHLYGTGSLAGAGQLGSAKQWSPALLVKYYFGNAQSTLRPFVGAGVSYVKYTDTRLTPGFQRTVSLGLSRGLTGALPTSATLESSWAPVVNAGLNYRFNDKWSATVSVSYLWLKTNADLYTATPTGNVKSTTRITIDPVVTLVALNYTF